MNSSAGSETREKPFIVRIAEVWIVLFLVVAIAIATLFGLMIWNYFQSPYHYGKTPEGSITSSPADEALRARAAVEAVLEHKLSDETVVTNWRLEVSQDAVFMFRMTLSSEEWTAISIDGLGMVDGPAPNYLDYDYALQPGWMRAGPNRLGVHSEELFLPDDDDPKKNSHSFYAWVVLEHDNGFVDVACYQPDSATKDFPDEISKIW